MIDTTNQSQKEIARLMPTLHFPPHWGIRILPPWGGAAVRMYVKEKNKTVSVYLDCDNNLGYMDEPYWEAYDGCDTYRCYLSDGAEALLNIIGEALNSDAEGM